MKLIQFNKTEYQSAFQQYVQEWQIEHKTPRDQHYYAKIYLDILGNYEQAMNQFLAESKADLLEQCGSWCQYYWWVKNNNILGTLRYRLNNKEIYGQVGYDVSPKHRGKGVAKKMLKSFIEVKQGSVKELYLTVPPENTASIKVIEANRGQFVQKLYFEEFDEYLNQYRIDMN